MMNVPKRTVIIAAVVALASGALMLGSDTSRAQTVGAENCVNSPGGALCTSAGVPGAYAGVPNAYAEQPGASATSAYAAVPDTFSSRSGTVFLPGAVANDGEVIGRDPDPDVRLNLMRDPNPNDLD